MTTVSPRSARGARTRGAILDAAQVMFVSPGYRQTSLRDVATRAGISHPGLLRHFATKGEILDAVIERVEGDSEQWFASTPGRPGDLPFVDIASRNAREPGYLDLFTTLAGEATGEAHPAHDRMRRRYARVRELAATILREGQRLGTVGAGRDLAAEACRLAAGWDGLQLMQLYLPDRVDVVDALRSHQHLLANPYAWPAPERDRTGEPAALPRFDLSPDPAEPGGYVKGRETRERIIREASALFAAGGYGDTGIRALAERVGISTSTLFHHFADKDDLLLAVLIHRDVQLSDHVLFERSRSAGDLLRDLPGRAALNARQEPGLIELYAVLSCEAAPPDHPAHRHFQQRFSRALDTFTTVFELARRDGDLPAHRDPVHEAVWLVALWDGLQFQWLYDRHVVDVSTHLAAHVADALPNSAPTTDEQSSCFRRS